MLHRGIATREGLLASHQLIEHDARSPDIGPAVHRLAAQLLGRHIAGCAHNGADLGHRGILDPGDAEIGDLHLTLGAQHDIGGLDIPVHHAALVAVVQGGEHLLHDLEDGGHGKALATLQHLLQGAARHMLHGDPGVAVILAIIIDRDDMGVVQSARGLGFTPETGHCLGAIGIASRGATNDLQRRAPFDHRVECVKHAAHRALTQGAAYFVLAKFFVAHDRGRSPAEVLLYNRIGYMPARKMTPAST